MTSSGNPSQINLPLDILGSIIDSLIAESRADSIKALKACALVSRTHVAQVQRHLFSAIYIRSKWYCTRFASFVLLHPHIALYIKELALVNDDSTDAATVFHAEDAIETILASVSNLQSLNIYYIGSRASFGFSRSMKLKNALIARCRTVPRFVIRGFHTLPIQSMLLSDTLKDVTIHMKIPRPRPYVPEILTHELPPEYNLPNKICQLERLNIDDITCAEPILKSHEYHQNSLKSLVVMRIPFTTALELVSHSQQSLERVSMTNMEDHPPVGPFDLDLPNLKRIQIAGITRRPTTPEQVVSLLRFTASIVECGDSTPRRSLRELYLTLWSDATEAQMTTASNTWARIDSALTHPRFDQFLKLSLAFDFMGVGNWPQGSKERIRECVVEMLPELGRRAGVRIEFDFLTPSPRRS